MRSTVRRSCALLATLLLLGAAHVRAHEYKLDALINAFVTVQGNEAHVVVRAPLWLFQSARFPNKNIEIDIPNSGDALQRGLGALETNLALIQDGQLLHASRATARLSLPSDRAFESYASAVRHVSEPVEPDTRIVIDQGYVDAHLVYPLRHGGGELSLHPTAAPELGDYLKVVVRFRPAQGAERTLAVTSLDGVVALNPTWWRAASGFVGMGMKHILTGADHLLFLLCLIIPLRGWRAVLAIVTTFTVAHSFTLIGSAFRLAPAGAWFPPLVEAAIAASIVYMALENIMGMQLARRMLLTGIFGLVHGFGFSYGLQENLQFAGTHLLVALFAFNLGIELGQLLVLAAMLPALLLVRRYLLTGRVGMVILCALVAQTGWQWMTERGADLAKVPWPRPTLAGVATLALWVAGILLAAAVVRALAARLAPARDPGHDVLAHGASD